MNSSPIRAVFLDAGNTLFTERRPRAEIYSAIAQEFGGPVDAGAENMVSALSRAFAELPQSLEGHFRFSLEWFRHFNRRVLGENGVAEAQSEAAHERVVEVFESAETYRVFDEVPQFLEDLRELGVQIGVISNWSERLPLLFERLELAEHVDFVIASADIRAEKPAREAFGRGLFRAGVPAEECLHIGDHPQRDVGGALASGLRAALLMRPGSTAEALKEDGVPVLENLCQALPLLDAVAQSSAAGR